MKTLQNLDSQGLIWKIFGNKDLEGKIRPKSGAAAAGILRPWPHFDVKELKSCFLAKAVGSSLVSYCSVAMISQMMWSVKGVRHRCEGSATYLWKNRTRSEVGRRPQIKDPAQAECPVPGHGLHSVSGHPLQF